MLEALAAALEKAHGIRAEALAADLSCEDGLKAAEERIKAAEALDILVNNAGFGTVGLFHKIDVGEQELMHRLHVLATLRLTHAALGKMTARDRGGIINVSSVAGFAAAPGNVSYCATKHWMNAFTEGLHMELRSAGSSVRVQALCPGSTYSGFHDRIKVDRASVPGIFWLRAEDVVADSLRGLDRGRLFVIPNWKYKAVVAVLSLLPGPLARRLAISRQRRFRRL